MKETFCPCKRQGFLILFVHMGLFGNLCTPFVIMVLSVWNKTLELETILKYSYQKI